MDPPAALEHLTVLTTVNCSWQLFATNGISILRYSPAPFTSSAEADPTPACPPSAPPPPPPLVPAPPAPPPHLPPAAPACLG